MQATASPFDCFSTCGELSPDVMTALAPAEHLLPLLRALAASPPSDSLSAGWALAHSLRLYSQHAPSPLDSETADAFLAATRALVKHRLRGGAATVLSALEGSDTHESALTLLEGAPLLARLLAARAPLPALASLYWPLMPDEEARGTSPVPLRALQTVSDSSELLTALWHALAKRLQVATALDDGLDDRSWAPPSLSAGVAGLPSDTVPLLGLLACGWEHALGLRGDDSSLSLSEARAVCVVVNSLVVSSRDPTHAAQCVPRTRLLDACSRLLNALAAWNKRCQFCPDGLWHAPAARLVV